MSNYVEVLERLIGLSGIIFLCALTIVPMYKRREEYSSLSRIALATGIFFLTISGIASGAIIWLQTGPINKNVSETFVFSFVLICIIWFISSMFYRVFRRRDNHTKYLR